MAFDIADLFTKVMDHLLTLGIFDQVNGHEPKSAPGKGYTAAVWIQDISTVPANSGLAVSSGRFEFNIRIYTNMLSEPQDAIDPEMARCVSTCFDSYAGDFDLGLSQTWAVDLLGAHGTPLKAVAGYINQDGRLYRCMTITLPVIINDIWQEVA